MWIKQVQPKTRRWRLEKGLIRKEKRMRDVITQYRRRHGVDQIAGG